MPLHVLWLTTLALLLDPRWWSMMIGFPLTKPERTCTHGNDGMFETILSPTTTSPPSTSSCRRATLNSSSKCTTRSKGSPTT